MIRKCIVLFVTLNGCVKSCQSSKTETWSLTATTLSPSLNFTAESPFQLVLSDKVLTFKQLTTQLDLKVTKWEKSDFATLQFQDLEGYFTWDVIDGQRREQDRPYACSEAPDSPTGITRVEETQKVKIVKIYLEKKENKEPQLNFIGSVPSQSFWVETKSYPIQLCTQGRKERPEK